ncbi:TraV family lipoprotein [Acidithiobacillus caldus ATCC 51756]|jgi:hypothetical protein|uniref:TraV family lipoprotein n=1 Tax=Acidithiobacillus caldus TaxID=33059 RepID=UPI001C065463|nr:TraV family lipoprotein [Acidithiobacillus caldus]MBU2734567.1 TraV family lipoprotein [Acidithiobacillus caldus ATCC 51756]MBU2801312.1 TraV family lipoprotein [Acidithiobacillus caldus]
MTRSLAAGSLVTLALLLSGCAQPGYIDVKTVPMKQAYERANDSGSTSARIKSLAATGAIVQPLDAPVPSIPIVEAPRVVMAYVYPWVDRNDQLHLGEWVGIPVTGFRWKTTTGDYRSIPNVGQAEPSIIGGQG